VGGNNSKKPETGTGKEVGECIRRINGKIQKRGGGGQEGGEDYHEGFQKSTKKAKGKREWTEEMGSKEIKCEPGVMGWL